MISRVAVKINALLENLKPQRTDGSPAVTWPDIAPGVEASVNDCGLTILDTVGDRVFIGSEAAALMWRSASRGLGVGETADVIAIHFGVERELAERRIRLFVEALEQNGLAVGKTINR